MIKRIRNHIFAGLLVVLPLAASIAITVFLFMSATNGAVSLLPEHLKENFTLRALIRGVTPIVLLIVLALVGMIARVVLIKKVFALGESILVKIPLFNIIYLSIKQISQAFFSHKKTVFNKVVALEYPRRGIYSVGFVTSLEKYEIHEKARNDLVSIFIPTSPNPTSGMLIYVPKGDIIELTMTIEEGMKLVISGGAVVPHRNVVGKGYES